ncbi:hypothetical protein OICFNHDK_4507 [Methylobacterium bullatum]|uniref:Uncharacterized protein n=1 Tax=Methylobacterium bullatum TaxID=570505 RepID=A0AAV4ZDS9_9HYPH|nr:hypothetical protein [Methylobacterium bullatum]GJD42016.1 hypothetical protein OICFNHDK_4507 [Methylobacterium bullatum]
MLHRKVIDVYDTADKSMREALLPEEDAEPQRHIGAARASNVSSMDHFRPVTEHDNLRPFPLVQQGARRQCA